MNDDLDLELNYMTLEDGTVIGTKKSYDRRAKVLDLIEKNKSYMKIVYYYTSMK